MDGFTTSDTDIDQLAYAKPFSVYYVFPRLALMVYYCEIIFVRHSDFIASHGEVAPTKATTS